MRKWKCDRAAQLAMMDTKLELQIRLRKALNKPLTIEEAKRQVFEILDDAVNKGWLDDCYQEMLDRIRVTRSQSDPDSFDVFAAEPEDEDH